MRAAYVHIQSARVRHKGAQGGKERRGEGDDDDGWAKAERRGDALGEVLAFDQAK